MRQYIWRKCSLQILSRLIGPKRGNAQSTIKRPHDRKSGAGGKQVKQLITAWQIAPPWRGEYENCNMKAVRTIEKLLVVDTCPIDRAETARYCAAGKRSKLKCDPSISRIGASESGAGTDNPLSGTDLRRQLLQQSRIKSLVLGKRKINQDCRHNVRHFLIRQGDRNAPVLFRSF